MESSGESSGPQEVVGSIPVRDPTAVHMSKVLNPNYFGRFIYFPFPLFFLKPTTGIFQWNIKYIHKKNVGELIW